VAYGKNVRIVNDGFCEFPVCSLKAEKENKEPRDTEGSDRQNKKRKSQGLDRKFSDSVVERYRRESSYPEVAGILGSIDAATSALV
jgi:hypothetical protein